MPACPNCGRQTQRTKDWACQWCGYPLISRAYKVIDKTFRELQEERGFAVRKNAPEPEPERPPIAPPPPVSQPPPESKPRTMPVRRPKPAKEKPAPLPQRPVDIQPLAGRSLPEHANTLEQKPMVPPPAPPISLPEAAAAPEPRPEIIVEPEAPREPPISLDTISDGMEISVDQLDALYRSDKSGAHSRFSGKQLNVTGIVDKVFIREHLEIRYITLKGTGRNMMWSLRCTFNREDAAKASRLNEGEAVMVRGKYDGFSKNIMVKDCVVV